MTNYLLISAGLCMLVSAGAMIFFRSLKKQLILFNVSSFFLALLFFIQRSFFACSAQIIFLLLLFFLSRRNLSSASNEIAQRTKISLAAPNVILIVISVFCLGIILLLNSRLLFGLNQRCIHLIPLTSSLAVKHLLQDYSLPVTIIALLILSGLFAADKLHRIQPDPEQDK